MRLTRHLAIILIAVCVQKTECKSATFSFSQDAASLRITTSNYILHIEKQGFRYGFKRPAGEVIVPPHAISGLAFAGGNAVETVFRDASDQRIRLEVSNSAGAKADVEIFPSENDVHFSITSHATKPDSVIARTGGVSPVFGLGDLGVRNRPTTELTGFVNDDFHATGDQCGRLISNFVISPSVGFAAVNVEPGPKIVRITQNENAQGTVATRAMPGLYYFIGDPAQIYRAFLKVRNNTGYRVFKPKYEWFGVGWEAWGALAWDTNEKTIAENVDEYLARGYPLSWMVVGSGFWPRQEPRFEATTSFGLWDTNLYPHPRALIAHFQERGLKFILGLRIAFITNGPFASDGLQKGCFMAQDGRARVFQIAFPHSPVYLLDAAKPEAVRWYVGLCEKWLAAGVDGFKEDLFGYGDYTLPDNKLDAVNAALMQQGVYVMGRNGYLGSPMDLHRFEDFNWDQNQDRGPLNGLAFAYSGFPYVYPDIVGGTFTIKNMPPATSPQLKKYFMRNAQYASVNPSMAMGYNPWNFKDAEVERVALAAAKLHALLQPYIYSAAVDTFESGFPYTMTPLSLAWPDDMTVRQLENSGRRGYEWMLGPSLLATPLYGDDYATAQSRDVYLPAGQWMDYDTGKKYVGPKTLEHFDLPPGKTPLFVGGKGMIVMQNPAHKMLEAVVYPVSLPGTSYQFTHPDGTNHSLIVNDAAMWEIGNLRVTDTTAHQETLFKVEPVTGAIRFSIITGHAYRIELASHKDGSQGK